MKNPDPSATASLPQETIAGLSKPQRLDGRYEIYDKIGAGAMSTVYHARDHKNAQDVAIKFMKTDLGGSARRRFFREFNTIAGIRHPCCLQVFEIGEARDSPYFTMELHPGQTLNSVMGDPAELIAPMLVDLSLAVDYIHSQGIVHRDIKPSNVMVQRDGDTKTGRLSCKLADFGLAKFYQLDSSLTAERGLVGTPAYCAPEQIDGAEIDHRVDLYAMAILAFELLAGGRHPFAAERTQGLHPLLHAQLSVEPPRLSDMHPAISKSVSDVIGSYLAKEPDLRPNSALPLRRTLCDEYGIEIEPRLEKLSSPADVKLNAVGFVCREGELAEVNTYLTQRFGPAPLGSETAPLLIFSGEPGTGKTSIMIEAVRRAVGMGVQVFEGRCFDGSTSSFQPIIEILRQLLTRHTRANRDVDESTLLSDFAGTPSDFIRMHKVVMSYQAELLRIAPDLRKWLNASAQAPAFRNESEYIFRALSSMFIELSKISPICLAFDDIQWADKSTLNLLQHLSAALRQAQAERRDAKQQPPPIAIICTARSGYDSLLAFQSRMATQQLATTVEMSSLQASETRELLALRLGCLANSIAPELAETIDTLCQGNPFFISETIREWHSRGMVVRTNDGWQRVHSSLDEDSSLPSTVRSALRTRVSDLSDTAKILVPAAATIGRIVDLDLLGDIVEDVPENDLLDAVDELLSKRILVETNTASRVSFAHDLLRETVLTDLSSNRRRAWHRKIASILETQSETSGKTVAPSLLAHHYLLGELTDQAFRYLLEAAQQAVRAYAFEDAMEYLDKAELHLPTGVSQEQQFRLAELIAEAAGRSTQFPRALAACDQALEFTDAPLARARILYQRASLLAVQSKLPESQEVLDEALVELGFRRLRWLPMQFLSIQFSLFAFHCIPAGLLGIINQSKRKFEENLLASDIYYEYAHSIALHNVVTYTQICASNVRRAKSLASDRAKGLAYSKYGCNLGFSGANASFSLLGMHLDGLSVRYGKMGLDHAKRDGREEVAASVQTSVGFCYYCGGQLDQAEQILLDAEKVLSRSRDLHASYVYHFLRHVYSVVGDTKAILDAGKKELEVARSTNNSEIMGWAQYGMTHAYALSGRFDEAQQAAEESLRLTSANRSGFGTISLMEQGFALMQDSQYDDAIAVFQQSYALMKNRYFFFEIAMALFPRWTEALIGPNWHQQGTQFNRRAAKKIARIAWFASFWFPNISPHTCRVLGRLNFASGNKKKAMRLFARSITLADRIGARYDKARTLLDQSLAGSATASEDRRHGIELLDALGAVIPQAEMKHHQMHPAI